MALIIGVVSQKGGVGKSTLARLLAREYAQAGWETLIADMDVSQGTSFEWNSRRLEMKLEPEISVQQFSTVDKALKHGDHYDIIIFDGAPHATRATLQIAEVSDLILLPTGNSKDDLNPQIRLAYELTDKGVDLDSVSFVLCRVGTSDKETEEVRKYISKTGHSLVEGAIPEKTAYRRAIDEGKSLNETNYPSLNEKAELVVQDIVNRLQRAVGN